MTAGPPGEDLSAAERRLAALLALLRAPEPRAADGLTESVMWRVRVDVALRAVATVIGSLAGALADGLALVLGVTPRGGRRPE